MKKLLLKTMLLLCALVAGMSSAWADVTWERVTSVATLQAGGTFILGYEGTANTGVIIPMANTGSATTSAAGFMYSGSTATSGGSGTIDMATVTSTSNYEVEIGASSEVDGAIYIKVGDNFLGNTNTKNNCKLFTEQAATTSFTPAVADDNFTLGIEENATYKYLKYNTGAPRFAVYSTTPEKIVIYKKVETVSTKVSTPIISGETSFLSSAKVSITCGTSDAVIQYTTDNGANWTNYSGPFTITETTTIKAKATKSGLDDSDISDGVTFTKVTPMTVAEAITAIQALPNNNATSEKYYVSGIVSAFYDGAAGIMSASSKRYYISDDGSTTTQLLVYNGKGLNNDAFSSDDDLLIGDRVIIYGSIQNYQGNTPEIASGNYILSLVRKTSVNMTAFTASATTLNVGGTATTEVSNDQPGWTAAYTYESSDDSKVTVDGDGNITAVAEGSATITARLNVSGSDNAYKAGDVTSMTVTITVTAAAIHTITYSINGNTDRTDSAAEGAEIDLPTDVDNIGGLTFVGWSETEASPVVISSNPTMGNSDKTFYAVWGKMSQSVDVLNNAFIGVEGTNYSNWSDKTGTSGAVYAGSTAGGNSAIQLRSNKNTDGFISTTSGGKVKKVVVAWNSNTAATRTIDIYGKNTAYSSAADLYGEDAGTKLGSICVDNATVLNITGDYTYIGIRSQSGALYLDEVQITWTGDADELYTTVAPVNVTVSDAQYATFCDELDRNFAGTGITVYMAKSDGTKVDLTEVTDGIVPAGKGVVLYSATEVTKAVPAATATAASYNDAENELVGITARTQVDAKSGDNFNYILSNEDEGIGFYAATDGNYLAANKAYLSTTVDPTLLVKAFLGFTEGDADAISEIVNGKSVNGKWYDLSGRRVSKATKGIYIVNGKKVVK